MGKFSWTGLADEKSPSINLKFPERKRIVEDKMINPSQLGQVGRQTSLTQLPSEVDRLARRSKHGGFDP